MIVNLTPHTLNVHLPDGSVRDIPPSGVVARVSTSEIPGDAIDGIPVGITTFGELVDLPEPVAGTTYVVSGIVADAASATGRRDVVSPGPLVRDGAGRPIGCRGLARRA